MESSDRQFEDDVRRLARAIFPSADGGHSEHRLGRERDGVFTTFETVVVIEATTSRRADKIKDDAQKTARLIVELRREFPTKFVRGILVTRDPPTADQNETLKKFANYQIRLESFKDFRSRLFDPQEYTYKRLRYEFGSAFDYKTDSRSIDETRLVELDLIDISSRDSVSVGSLKEALRSRRPIRAMVVGDYGAGKSTTLFQLWRDSIQTLNEGVDNRLPIFPNLRDHSGQDDPVEALERHARKIGYGTPHQLVSAFRSGEVILFLDGVDELSPFARLSADSRKLRDIRRKTVILVKRLIVEAPQTVPILVSTRAQFFDTDEEMRNCLSLNDNWRFLSLSEFSEDQIRKFLDAYGHKGDLPIWLPGRPLLLGYLVARGWLSDIQGMQSDQTPSAAWNQLLDLISQREADRIKAEPADVRLVIERVATLAGSRGSGLGPIEAGELLELMRSVGAASLDDASEQLVLRLPGLGPDPAEPHKRSFVDPTLADVARAGDVARFAQSPFAFTNGIFVGSNATLSLLAADVARYSLDRNKISSRQISAAMEVATRQQETWALATSLACIIKVSGLRLEGGPYCVREAIIDEWFLTSADGDLSQLTFNNCLFDRLDIDPDLDADRSPRFRTCSFINVIGRVSESDLPTPTPFEDCSFESFGRSINNTAEILAANLQPLVKVICTCLEKLFLQPGRARDESAFPRGLDPELRKLVTEALDLIRVEGFASTHRTDGKSIWRPDRTKQGRVRSILSAPNATRDGLIERARATK